jgi:hypothetical protein
MARPPAVKLKRLTFGSATTQVRGTDRATKVTVTPLLDVIWAATGTPLLAEPESEIAAAGGGEAYLEVVNPAQDGFIDGRGNVVRDYGLNVAIEYLDAKGKRIGSILEKKFLVDDTDEPADLDLMVPVTNANGTVVYVPDSWSEQVTEAQKAAIDALAAAQLAAESSALDEDGKLLASAIPEYLEEESLSNTIGTAVAGKVDAVPTPIYLDSYTKFFPSPASVFVTGQTNIATALTAAAAQGATSLAVASGAGLLNGVTLVTNPGTADQQILTITAGGGTSALTVSPALKVALPNGAPIAPLWKDEGHLSEPAGWKQFGYWLAHSKRPDGSLTFQDPGTRPVVWLGNSWAVPQFQQFPDALKAMYPNADVRMLGVGGNNSGQLLDRWASVPSNAAYVIINEPGVNDTASLSTLATQTANLEKLIGLIRGIGSIPVITGAVPLVQYTVQSAAQAANLTQLLSDPANYPATLASSLDKRFTPASTLPSGTVNVGGGSRLDTAGNNTVFGRGASAQTTTGGANSAFGLFALAANAVGNGNCAFGQGALQNFLGHNTVMVGGSAGGLLTTGQNNVGVGSSALGAAVTASHNTGVGSGALRAATGNSNCAYGRDAGGRLTSGSGNILIGTNAGEAPNFATANATTTASNQTIVGSYAGQNTPTQRSGVTAVGYSALVGGDYATAVGNQARADAAGSVAIGADSAGAGAVSTVADLMALGTAKHRVGILGRLNVAPRTPTSSADAQGLAGDIATDDDYVYVKTSTGWKRAALTTW